MDIVWIARKRMEEIIIKDLTYPEPIRRYCFVINEYLGVVPFENYWKIYKIKQGKPFIGTRFSTKENAVQAARVLSSVYAEYLPILDTKEWQDANIPALCRWSVRNGLNLWKLVQQTERYGKPIECASLYERLA